MDIRKVALVAFIAAVLSLVSPLWNATRQMKAITSSNPGWALWIIAMAVVVIFFSALMPSFYFALYRTESPLRLPRHFRSLSLTAALVLSIFVAMEFYWVADSGAWGSTSVLTGVSDAWNMRRVSGLLGAFADLSYVLLLFAFFQNSKDESAADLPISTLLARVTNVVVKVWVVWLAVGLLRVIMMPVIYVQLRDSALRAGGTRPELSAMIFDALRMLAVQSCLFIAPFIIYRSRQASERHKHEQAQED